MSEWTAAIIERFKKIQAGITGGVYESPAPLRGEVTQSTRYSGNTHSGFRVDGGEYRSPLHPLTVNLTGAADDNAFVSGQAVRVSTGDGNDTLLARGSNPLDRSTVDLGNGNDTFDMTASSYRGEKGHNQQGNIILGGNGTDTLVLDPRTEYGVHVLSQVLNKADASPAGYDLRIERMTEDGDASHPPLPNDVIGFERLRFDITNPSGHGERHTFDLDKIQQHLFEGARSYYATGFNNPSIRFDPNSKTLKLTHYERGRDGEEVRVEQSYSPLEASGGGVCENPQAITCPFNQHTSSKATVSK